MSTADDYDCEDAPAVRGRCDVCIDQLIVIGTEVMGALTGPAEAALDGFAAALLTITRRLKWGARKLLEALEAVAVALGPMPACPPGGPQPPPEGGGGPTTEGTAGAEGAPTVEMHDFDQPNLLILADASQPWHQRLREWYVGALDSVLLSGSLKDAVQARSDSFPPPEPPPFEIPDIP